jgi:DNA processing protein
VPEAAVRALPALSEEERRVYDAIRETETSIDDIATKAELPSGTVSSTLLRLELKRLVKQLPGKYFVKLG